MDKSTFMGELRESLAVLNEEELQDILNEYEQHIDMKIKSGLTEEAAIADFGSVTELSAEILEAYHVRADYAAKRRSGKIGGFWKLRAEKKEPGAEEDRAWIIKAEDAVGGIGKGKAAADGIVRWFLNVLRFWRKQIARPFRWSADCWRKWTERNRAEDVSDGVVMESGDRRRKVFRHGEQVGVGAGEGARMLKRAVGGIGWTTARIIHRCWQLAVRLAFWCVRTAWNVCWGLFALLCGICGMLGLFGLGILAVLLLQGYPVAGMTVGCLGLTGSLFSAAGLGITFWWKKEQKAHVAAGIGSSGGEDGGEQYA